jgi:hypothetical protein
VFERLQESASRTAMVRCRRSLRSEKSCTSCGRDWDHAQKNWDADLFW